MVYRCLFEQSGTFKNEFKKLGYEAFDYDILNDFNETDYQIDLYEEIDKAYDGKPSIFDTFDKTDVVLAFFPCIRFENQILLWFRGDCYCQRNWDDIKKLEYAMKLQNELTQNYIRLSKLIIVLKRLNISLIIENPYSTQHYLITHFPIRPAVIDKDRSLKGDYMKKPTAYWFIGIEPKHNQVNDPIKLKEKITNNGLWWDKNKTVKRSLISPDYVNRFIKEYIIEVKDND
jgi:hypothetical protein